jgi:uncharacterized RDD family membrane protein YckC
MDAAQQSNTVYCAECGRPSTPAELVRFGELMICPVCQESHRQKLPGSSPAAAATGAYAGFWIRVAAYLIDTVILWVIAGVLQGLIFGSMMRFPRLDSGEALDQGAIASLLGLIGTSLMVQFAVAACYEGFFVAKLAATPGKMVIGAKVVCADGSAVSLGRAFGRYFAKILSGLILCIGFILVGLDSQKRGLHDMICDTRVIRSRS